MHGIGNGWVWRLAVGKASAGEGNAAHRPFDPKMGVFVCQPGMGVANSQHRRLRKYWTREQESMRDESK